MRRIQIIAVILALLATPLALLAQSRLGGEACNRMCCLPHGRHAGQMQNDMSRAQGARGEAMDCHHGAAGHTMKCQMRANSSGSLSSPLAPIPPTLLSAGGQVTAPAITSEITFVLQEKASTGFSFPLFEPPRV